jgi:hypothetical protein
MAIDLQLSELQDPFSTDIIRRKEGKVSRWWRDKQREGIRIEKGTIGVDRCAGKTNEPGRDRPDALQHRLVQKPS